MDHYGGGNSSSEEHTSVNATRRERRTYHRHTAQQTQALEAFFKECPHPDESQRLSLCRELNMEPDQIKFWFQNKRTQNKAQDERHANIFLRQENERIKCENEAMMEALKNVLCPACGGPPFGEEHRHHNVRELSLHNTFLRAERDKMAEVVSKCSHQQTMLDSFAYVQGQQIFDAHTSYGSIPNNLNDPSTSQDIQRPLLSQMDIAQLSEIAEGAVEELKRLLVTEEALWVMSSIDGAHVIDQNSYEKFSHSIRQLRHLNSRVESSKDVMVVPVEATNLVEMFSDSEKWRRLFPTIVTQAMTIHKLESELPIRENCNNLQVILEQLQILSPLVPPREFMILRCCQKINEGLWIVADVSHRIVNPDQISPVCYKRPSGCFIRALPNAHSEVTWIEHVEVGQKPETHRLYKEIMCGGSGYGAKRWTASLERMCERMALSSTLTIPATDWGEAINTWEGRRSVMELGERMLKNFNQMLTMSGKVEFPHQSKRGVRIAVRMNNEAGQPSGLVISAASAISVPVTPLQVFNSLLNIETRHQWDVLCKRASVSEIAHVLTGSNENNYISILEPTPREVNAISMSQGPNKKMVMLQECYMDALGGMIVYAPLDMATMNIAASGRVDPMKIPILSSGFTISNDGRRRFMGAEEGGTILTVAFQIIVSAGEDPRAMEWSEQSLAMVSSMISSTVQDIKRLLNCPLD